MGSVRWETGVEVRSPKCRSRAIARHAASLVALAALLPTAPSGAQPAQPTHCQARELNASENATLEIDLDFKDQSRWPSGCVLHARMEPGGTVTARIRNVNVGKYRVSINGEEAKRESEKPPQDLEAILPALATTKPADSKVDANKDAVVGAIGKYLKSVPSALAGANDAVKLMAQVELSRSVLEVREFEAENANRLFDNALDGFELEAAKLEGLGKALDKASKAEGVAESYRELVAAERAALSASPVPTGCSPGEDDAVAVACAAGLGRLQEQVESSVEDMGRALLNLELYAAQASSTASDYVLDAAKRKYQAAKQLAEKVPSIASRIARHQRPEDRAAVENELFSHSKSFDFEGGRLAIEARVEEGPKDKATTLYKVQVKVEPTRTAAFSYSSGFVFSGLTDRSYAIEEGRIVRRGDEDDFRPGVAALAHWHPRVDAFALSAGVAGKDSELQYLIGFTWIDGWKQKFALTIGAALGSVSRLDRLSEGDEFDEGTVPTRDVQRASAFLAVSFHF